MIDDSELFHGTYDPVKAREYYLRTRKLKGRKPGKAVERSPVREGRRPAKAATAIVGQVGDSKAKARREALKAEKAALEKRLDRLREVLKEKVAAAKGRSGVSKKSSSSSKDKAPETKADKADRNKDEKDRKPLTASQKAKKAKAAKEAYEKEHPNSLSDDIEILHEQIKDIRAKIEKAIEDSRSRKPKAGVTAAIGPVRSQPKKPNDGPRGR